MSAEIEWCDCLGPEAEEAGYHHTVKDHRWDCGGWTVNGPPCGGCVQCQAAQHWYYKELEEQEKREAWQEEKRWRDG